MAGRFPEAVQNRHSLLLRAPMASTASPIPPAFLAQKRLRASPPRDLGHAHQLCIPAIPAKRQRLLAHRFQSIASPRSLNDEGARRWKSAEELHLEEIPELPDYNDLLKDVSTDDPHAPEFSQEHTEEHMTINKDLSLEQKIRMESNKAAALAKRNLRICEEKVAEAQAQGLPLPKFESLLVEKKWLEAFQGELQKPYMENLHQYVSQEMAGKIPIYPPPAKIFNAFNLCPFDKVKVVIIGQDPYHGPGQATGLCFSVEKGVKLPSSLGNIFKEIQNDVGCPFPSHGNLEKWAHQGVLLLNTVLTVREHHANSHAKKGWEPFTDAAIRAIAQQRSGLVFLLWGNSAQEKIRLINKTNHHILKAVHPSGISAHRGFFDCRHFSKTNKILEGQGLLPIDWKL